MSMGKWATSKSTQLSTKVCVKLLLLLANVLTLDFEGLLLTENLNPLQGPTHPLTPSSMNTENRSKKLRMDLSWHALHSMREVKTLRHTENKGRPTPANYVCFSPVTSRLESFGHKSTPSHRPWTGAYYSNILSSTKKKPKCQLSQVPGSGNSWLLFTFSSHKYSHSLQLAK